jgi:hypothetical protein
MNNIYSKVFDSFSNEILTNGDVWRIFRRGTFVDLIRVSYADFQIERDEKHLIEIFNLAMKVKLLSRIAPIEVGDTLEEFSKKINKDPELILRNYEIIFSDLEPIIKEYASSGLYDLNIEVQYFKVINQLEIDSYSDEVFNKIIGITYNLLQIE